MKLPENEAIIPWTEAMQQFVWRTGVFAFLMLGVLASVFYKERVAFIDLSYQTFLMIMKGGFAFQSHRYAAILVQIFPLMALICGAGIKTMMIFTSIGYIIIMALVFALLHVGYHQYKLALTFLILVLGMTTHTFYWTQSELQQGIWLLFILMAHIEHIKQHQTHVKPISYVILLVLALFIGFSHPLAIVGLLFILIWQVLFLGATKQTLWVLFAGIVVGQLAGRFILRNYYDQQAMGRLDNFIKLFPNYFILTSNKNFLLFLFRDYYVITLLLVGITVYYIKRKLWLKLAISLGSAMLYSLMVNVSFPNNTNQFYLENQYMMMGLLVMIPFSYDLLIHFRPRTLVVFTLLVSFTGIWRIHQTHAHYTQRLKVLEGFIKASSMPTHPKIVVWCTPELKSKLMLTWAVPMECWLLNAIENKPTPSVIVETYPGEFDASTGLKSSWITKWENFEYQQLPTTFFHFTDTLTSYQKVTDEALDDDSIKVN